MQKLNLTKKYNFGVTKEPRKKLTVPVRQKLIAKKLTDNEKADAIEMLKAGYTVWDVTEIIHNFPFEHNDKKTWVFYARINSLRHKCGLNPVKLEVTPETTRIISEFVKKFGEAKLKTLLAAQLKVKPKA